MKALTLLAATLLTLAACGDDDQARPTADADPAATVQADSGTVAATALASGRAELDPDELEAGRLDSTWRRYARMDSAGERRPGTPDSASADRGDRAAVDSADGTPGDSAATGSWDDIAARTVNARPAGLPIRGDREGPAVAKVQILLDQARFSPGVIDGRWGKNTEKAIYWFQKANGLNATGEVDRRTLDALAGTANRQQVVRHQLTDQDVAGPFETLPEDIYARAGKECLCYESKREKLAEMFHTTPELLEQLNPDVDLEAITAGTTLDVPAVEPFHLDQLLDGRYTGGGDVARIVVSGGGHYVHAMDGSGTILYHFPSTLGSDYAPSPTGNFRVESITFDPTWHYQPDLLTGVDPSEDDAVLPAGPNNAVGVVWMALSKPHYGIHGTAAPETIGYATSHGCVRLTNWDAGFLGQRIPPGVAVEFRDVDDRG